MYELALKRWVAGKLSVEQVDLLVLTGYITEEQGNTIKQTTKVA